MLRLKKALSVIMVCVLGAGMLGACGTNSDKTVQEETQAQESASGSLKLAESGFTFKPEDRLARFKSEYLLENQGYRDEDEVVAILSLKGDSLADSYLKDEEISSRLTLGEYAVSANASSRKRAIEFEQTDLIRAIGSMGVEATVDYRYSTLVNAVAVRTTYRDFLKIEKLNALQSAAISETYASPQDAGGTDASAIVNAVDVYETGIFNGQSAKDPSGNPYTGKKTSVAVLDSGFDLSHPAFNTHVLDPDELMFNEDDISAFLQKKNTDGSPINAVETTPDLALSDVYYSDKIPFHYDYADKDPDVMPYDSEHGTHVAGIIGGRADSYQDKDGNTVMKGDEVVPFQGIAQDTQLVLMKVFPDLSSGADTTDILAALEDAVLLNVDAINMSLGSACGFAREKDGDIINTVYDKINESGVSLVTAASNMYSSGYGGAQGNTNFVTNPDSGTVGSPASYAPALSVASINGIKSKYIIGNGSQVFFFNESNSISGEENDIYGELYEDMGWSLTDGAEHTLEYVSVPGYGKRADYTPIKSRIQGKVALVSRGDNTFEDKALQAKNAGAIACIIYNNIDGDIIMSMGKTDHIPTISISKEDGTELAKRTDGTLTFCYKQEAGPFMSDFSSWGPLPDLTLKPEITAHGGNITSSVPGGGYDQISGTSMACPNMCGLVVLIRQYIKDNYDALIGEYDAGNEINWKKVSVLANQMLMSTATIILNEQGNPYSPRKQGAGLASLVNVVNTKAYLTVDGKDRTKLELFDDPGKSGVYEMVFNVVNTSGSDLRYDLGLVGMTESVSTADSDHVAERGQLLKGGFTASVVEGQGSVNGTQVTVAKNSTLKLKVVYTLTDEDKNTIEYSFPYGMYVEGFVKLVAEGDGVDLNIPFLAFYGDWSQAPIFDKTYYEVESEAHNAGIDEEDKIKADYYATTPYGSYFYNYIIPLGAYLYDIDESAYDPIPASLDHIAISDTVGRIDGIGCVYAGLLRGCKKMSYTITDKLTGEVVYTFDNINANKAYSQGGSPIPNFEYLRINSASLGLVNNRKYEFKMVGELDYKNTGLTTNVRNTFAFDFTLDNEAPVIKSATYEKEYDKTLKKDRYYINLTVYDNQYAMSITPMIFSITDVMNSNGIMQPTLNPSYPSQNPIPIYGDRGQDAVVRFEITDYLENVEFDELMSGQLSFMIEDYALNSNIYMCTLPGTCGGFSFTSDGTFDAPTLTGGIEIGLGEVRDLTDYLATKDGTVDANKDYLRYLVWTSSDSSVSVKEGQVVGMSAGSSVITVTEQFDGVPLESASVLVTVVPGRAAGVSAENVDGEGGKRNAVVPISQNNVPDVSTESIKSIRFSYFDTIFAHYRAGQQSQIGDTGDRIFLTSTGSGVSVYPGEKIRLHYDLDPWYVADKYEVSYRSTDETVATVDQDGNVEALKKGSTQIILSVNGSNLIAVLYLTVNSEFVIDDARTLVAYKGRGGDVVIPDDEGILYIGPFAFSLYETNYDYSEELPDDDIYANRNPQTNNTVTSVVVPEGVTEIQQHAFYNCTRLERVTLPESCQFIRQYCFYGNTSLQSINLNHIESIGRSAFEGCRQLTSLMEGDATNKIKAYAVGTNGFMNCKALATVDLTNLRNTGRSAFEGCTNLKSVVLTENTKLSERMFYGCGLLSVDIHEKNFIPASAFAKNTSLATVNLSNSLNSIRNEAFAGDENLKEIKLPNSSFTLGANVFDGCASLAKVILQQGTRLTATQGALFTGAGVTTFEIDGTSDYYTVGDEGHQLLGEGGSVIVLAAVKYYTGDNSTLRVSSSVKRVSGSAFAGSELTSVTFEGPIELSAYAFANCAKLETVTLAAGEGTTIGNGAFSGCAKLKTVTNLDKVKVIGDNAFAAPSPVSGSGSSQTSSSSLGEITLGDGTKVGENAFRNSSVTAVTLGKDVTLGEGAFYRCTLLTKVIIPGEGNVTVGRTAFYGDTALSEIDLSKAVGTIGDLAFMSCEALTTADLSNVTVIGERAFANCPALSNVTLGEGLTEIGNGAFMDYNSYVIVISGSTSAAPWDKGAAFKELTLPASLETIGVSAFVGCKSLQEITIPDRVESVPDNAFAYCTALEKVVLPAAVKKIGASAFMACEKLGTINLGSVEVFGDGAFTSAGHTQGAATDMYLMQGMEFDLSSAKTIGFGAFADTKVGGNRAVNAPELTEIGGAAFQNATFSSFSAPKLQKIDLLAFDGCTSLTGFAFSDRIESVGSGAFNGCTKLKEFTFNGQTDGKINGYAQLIDGVLYVTLKSGKLQLSSVPAGKEIGTLEVYEGTARIDSYAGSSNKNIDTVILPDSLEAIGNYAFYGYITRLTVEFRSVTAPVLESGYTSAGLSENSPGFDILHAVQDVNYIAYYLQYGSYPAEDVGYYNFVGLLGTNTPLNWRLPANQDISGYDGLAYLVYFGPVEDAERTEYVAMEQAMKDFLWYAKQVQALNGQITMADETLLTDAVKALNAIKQDPKDYGYSDEEWKALTDSVLEAHNTFLRLRISNAKKVVRDIQARIDALPDVYDGSPEHDALIEALRADIEALSVSDRALLIQTKYLEFLDAYNKAHQQTEEPPQEEDNDKKGLSVGAIVGISVAAGVVAIGACVAVVLVVLKKKKKPEETSEEAAAPEETSEETSDEALEQPAEETAEPEAGSAPQGDQTDGE